MSALPTKVHTTVVWLSALDAVLVYYKANGHIVHIVRVDIVRYPVSYVWILSVSHAAHTRSA